MARARATNNMLSLPAPMGGGSGQKDRSDLIKFRTEFLLDYKAEREFLKEIEDDNRFYDGDQWTDQEQRELEERGQPIVVNNRIKPKIDSIVGIEMGNQVDMKAFPRGRKDFRKAVHISEALRYSEYHTKFDSKENEAFRRQIIGGLAWYKKGDKWDGLQHSSTVELKDADEVIRDRHSFEIDLSDSRWIHHTILADMGALNELYPDKKDQIKHAIFFEPDFQSALDQSHRNIRPDQYDSNQNEETAAFALSPVDYELMSDRESSLVRAVTTQYREPYTRTFLTAPQLGTEEVTELSKAEIQKILRAYPGAREWRELKYKLNEITFLWNTVLEHKKDIRSFDEDGKFTYVMVPGWRYRQREKRRKFYGLVRGMKDAQKEVNKRRSKMLHYLHVNQIFMEDGAVENEERARNEVSRPDGVVKYKPQHAFKVERNIELAQSQFQLLQESKVEIDNTGVQQQTQGGGSASSGREFKLRHESALQPMRPLLMNLSEARKRVFALILDDIQQYWTEEQVIDLTDSEDSEPIVLNQRVPVFDPVSGKVTLQVQNNVSLGKYDLIIEESPETLNLMSEEFSELVSMAKAGMPVPMDMIVEASSLPNKAKLLERMRREQQIREMEVVQQALAGGGAGQ